MSELTTDITIDGTDYTINIDRTDDTLAHHGYVHYNEDLNIYFIISHKTHNQTVLETTVHDWGTNPSIVELTREDIRGEKIHDELSKYDFMTAEDIDGHIDFYLEDGERITNNNHNLKNSDHSPTVAYSKADQNGYLGSNVPGFVPDGMVTAVEKMYGEYLEDDEVTEVAQDIFTTLKKYTPTDYDFAGKLECGDADAWRLRALVLYQNSVLENKPQLCKVQALREAGHRPFEISDILDTHPSTVSHQLNTIDNWLETAGWTTQNVTSD